jgi:hypothetical protein
MGEWQATSGAKMVRFKTTRWNIVLSSVDYQWSQARQKVGLEICACCETLVATEGRLGP